MNIFNLIKSKIKSKLFKNTGWLLFEKVFRMALSLVVTSLMARYLGTYNYGLISYGAAYVAIFTTISNLGIDSILVHEIIKSRKDTGKLIGTSIVLRILSSLFSIIMVYVIVVYLNPSNITLQLITFIQSISLIFLAFDTVGFWFQSNLQSKYAVISKSIAFTIISTWRLILIYIGASVEFFAISTILEAAVIGVFLVIFYFKHKGPKFSFSIETAKHLLLQGYNFIIAGLLVTVYTQMDKIMLGQMTDESTVGIYAAAMTVAGLWIFIPLAIIESARPVIMTAKDNNEDLYIKRTKQLFCSIIWIGIIASIFITALAKPIILLIFGSQFTESIGVLIILIWSRIFSLIGTARSIWLISENQIKYLKYFIGIGAIVNVVCNLVLIPKYGAVGAAVGTIFAEVLSSTFALLIFRETRPLFKLLVESFLFRGIINTEHK
ncbi:flippase [Bacillus massilinigeriensis]|uniref:flippase n=1 Tax=Bacillus massilionigeriensis TaxID=1805475 RepID=UPI00096B4C4E|nr:flippase [Bacillus massilionigeriensis]